jgi:hypothetical protein
VVVVAVVVVAAAAVVVVKVVVVVVVVVVAVRVVPYSYRPQHLGTLIHNVAAPKKTEAQRMRESLAAAEKEKVAMAGEWAPSVASVNSVLNPYIF